MIPIPLGLERFGGNPKGTSPMNLRWILTLGGREVHFNPLFDVDAHARSDSNSSVGARREGTPPMNSRWILTLGGLEVHITPLLDIDAHALAVSSSPVGTLREGALPVDLR